MGFGVGRRKMGLPTGGGRVIGSAGQVVEMVWD